MSEPTIGTEQMGIQDPNTRFESEPVKETRYLRKVPALNRKINQHKGKDWSP